MTEPIDYSKLESAIGLNWYQVDPDLKALMDRYLPPEDRGWAEERLQRWGEICGGPIAANAEVSDRNPPQLERYDAWGNETNRVVHNASTIDTKRSIWEEGPHALEAAGKEVPSVLRSAFTYLLSQSDTGMVCATGMTDGVIETPNGAHFTECPSDYGRDEAFQSKYAKTAKDPDAWQKFKADYLDVSEDEYQQRIAR